MRSFKNGKWPSAFQTLFPIRRQSNTEIWLVRRPLSSIFEWKNKGPDEGSTERREATESSPFNRSEGYEITRLKTIGCEGTRSFRYREGAKNLWSWTRVRLGRRSRRLILCSFKGVQLISWPLFLSFQSSLYLNFWTFVFGQMNMDRNKSSGQVRSFIWKRESFFSLFRKFFAPSFLSRAASHLEGEYGFQTPSTHLDPL